PLLREKGGPVRDLVGGQPPVLVSVHSFESGQKRGARFQLFRVEGAVLVRVVVGQGLFRRFSRRILGGRPTARTARRNEQQAVQKHPPRRAHSRRRVAFSHQGRAPAPALIAGGRLQGAPHRTILGN